MNSILSRIVVIIFLLLPALAIAHGVSDADQEILNSGGLLSYIYVGAKHMLTGYDHILFIIGVVFYLNGFKDIVKFISVFTVGHCITLLGATYLNISINEHVIDAIIALSVVYKGFENLGGFQKIKLKSPNLLMMVFIFGLIHGLGLSTRLQSFDIGNELFLAKIFSFNIGVELGQVIALIPIVMLITYWKTQSSFKAFYQSVNTYLIVAGLLLFAYQLNGYFQFF
ncbi:MAG: HupE/UreJ family protein [Psychroserpens sp.]|uniref:HupE/UreJ family protein n=1 Tax=Psychroserpens sp. TaxID=2020870 RepID=UPI003CBE1534